MNGILLDFELDGAMCKTWYRLGGIKCNKLLFKLIEKVKVTCIKINKSYDIPNLVYKLRNKS